MDIKLLVDFTQLIINGILITLGASAIGGTIRLFRWYKKKIGELEKIEEKILKQQEHYIAMDENYPQPFSLNGSLEYSKLQRDDRDKERANKLNLLREKRQHILDRMNILSYLKGH